MGEEVKQLDIDAVEKFKAYLRIATVHPDPDYYEAVAFLAEYARLWDLPFRTVELSPGKPICIISKEGERVDLPSLILTSHMDVVPVDEEKWSYPPFSAEEENTTGRIFARGSQDMKCVGMQHLEAVGRLHRGGKKFKRTIHILFTPDEEIGSRPGASALSTSHVLSELSPWLFLDEGLSAGKGSRELPVYFAERAAWWFKIQTTGSPGHGSQLVDNTATEKLMKTVERLRAMRKESVDNLRENSDKVLGDVISVNMTYIKAGVTTDHKKYSMNVIPMEAEAGFDVRIPPSVELKDFKEKLERWCADDGTELKFIQILKDNFSTDYEPYWKCFDQVAAASGCTVRPSVFPAATDSRFYRRVGHSALGISYLPDLPVLLHDNDEYLDRKTFVEGIHFFENLVSKLADCVV